MTQETASSLVKVPNKQEKKKFVNSIMYFVSAPIIVMPGYKTSITNEMYNKAMLFRMKSLKDIDNEMCSDYELCLYLMSASLIDPLPYSWGKIYQNVFSRCFGFKMIDPEGKPPVLEEAEEYEMQKMKKKIFQKQMEQLKV